ncbi:MAG: hypothetical protein WAW85_05725, partial [Gordonia sp. (in: high G+C Gram-positive bacteria)]|uniref:hypothetical protein n=1 Tax=Gordonia sp. (in: high G+C Gram-positive bacteria) TaxID=84139 RepID=UPI003BB4CA31
HVITAPSSDDTRPLINALIGSYDTSAENSVRGYIAQQLAAVGVVALTPEPGSVFDAASARCVATERVPGREPGTIIRVDRPGWLAPAGPIRLPDVTVAAQPDRG